MWKLSVKIEIWIIKYTKINFIINIIILLIQTPLVFIVKDGWEKYMGKGGYFSVRYFFNLINNYIFFIIRAIYYEILKINLFHMPLKYE